MGAAAWAILAVALAAVLVVDLRAGRSSRLRIPSAASIVLSGGNLGFGGIAVVLSSLAGYGLVPDEVSLTASLTFVTMGLLLFGLIWISAGPGEPGRPWVDWLARGLALANGVPAIGLSAVLAWGLLHPPAP